MELSLAERITESEQVTLSENSDLAVWQTENMHFFETNIDRLYDILKIERTLRIQRVLRLEDQNTLPPPPLMNEPTFINEPSAPDGTRPPYPIDAPHPVSGLYPIETPDPVDARARRRLFRQAEEATKLITNNLEQLQELQKGMDGTPISFVSLEKSVKRLAEWKKDADLKRLTHSRNLQMVSDRQNDLDRSLRQGLFKLEEKTDKFSREDYDMVAQALNAALAALDET